MQSCIAHKRGTPPLVGEFFESYARSLLGLQIVEHDLGGGADFSKKKTWFGVEVKSSDSNHDFRISLAQLSSYIDLGNFPRDGVLYCLVGYCNRRRKVGNKKVRTPLSVCRSKTDLHLFLAQHLEFVYLLDSLVLKALVAKVGVRKGSLPCQPEAVTLNLARQWLQGLFVAPNGTLFDLELPPESWSVDRREVVTNFEAGLLGDVEVKINFGTVLQKSFLESLEFQLKKRYELLI